jgi:adenosine deaminase
MLIDTHCHLGGCLSPEFIWNAVQKTGQSYLAESLDDVRANVLFSCQEERSFDKFLNKFSILNKIKWTPDLIELAVEDAGRLLLQNDFTLLSISLEKYLNIGWHKRECVAFLSNCFKRIIGSKVKLLLGLKYEYTKTMMKQHASLIDDPDLYDTFAGIDFVGNERMVNLAGINPVLENWKDRIIRLHVGETSPSDIVSNMLNLPYLNRLAHATSADGDCRERIRGQGVAVDMCLSSNYFTGLIDDFSNHPIKAFAAEGVHVTIGSDDPIQFNTDISKEYRIAIELGLDCEVLVRNSKSLLPNHIG